MPVFIQKEWEHLSSTWTSTSFRFQTDEKTTQRHQVAAGHTATLLEIEFGVFFEQEVFKKHAKKYLKESKKFTGEGTSLKNCWISNPQQNIQAFPSTPSKFQWHLLCAPHRKHPKAHRSMPIWCEHLEFVSFWQIWSGMFLFSLRHLRLEVIVTTSV